MTESYVLIIDASEDCCVLLEKIFIHKCRLPARGVGSGRQALELVEQQEPLLIVFDLRLPDIEALELIAGLRRPPHGQQRILIGTATQSGEEVRRWLKSGILDAFLPKPLDIETLITTVRKLLRRRRVSQ